MSGDCRHADGREPEPAVNPLSSARCSRRAGYRVVVGRTESFLCQPHGAIVRRVLQGFGVFQDEGDLSIDELVARHYDCQWGREQERAVAAALNQSPNTAGREE